jgi:hypothetical protein
MEPEAVLTLLMVGASICALWVCLPDVLLLLGLAWIRRGILAGPDEVRTRAGDWLTEEIAQELDALRFEPACIYWERLLAHKTFHEVVFIFDAGDCFASVYRLLNDEPQRVAFKTSFSDGAFVLTQNYAGGMEADEGTLRAGGLLPEQSTSFEKRAPLAIVLDEHRQRVRRLVLAGHEPLPARTVLDHVEAERRYSDHPAVQRTFRASVALLFPIKLVFLSAGPSLVAAIWGVHHPAIWAILLGASISVLLFRYHGHPLLEALDRLHSAVAKSP